MATSGEYQLLATRNSILEDAAEVAGILDPEGGQLTKGQYTRIAGYLNNMIKSWQADGMQVWIRKKIGIILESGVVSYTFDVTGADTTPNCFPVSASSTTFTSGTGVNIVVASTSGMAHPYIIGIEKTNGTYHWSTIASVTNSTNLVLDSGGTNYKTGGRVYFYAEKAPKPLRVYDGYVRNSQGQDTPVKILTQEEYNRFGVKTNTGLSTQVFYDMQWPHATLYVYPTVNFAGSTLYIEAAYPFQVFKDSQHLPDFPEEWQNALIYGLAEEIGFRYGMDEKRLKEVQTKAKYWRDMALGMSQETSVYLQPMHNMYGQK